MLLLKNNIMNIKYILTFVFCYASSFCFSQNTITKINDEVIEYKKIDTVSLKLHIYKPLNFSKDSTYNCIVFFHGGGWNSGNYKAFRRQSMYFASRGMIAISAEYRLKNTHQTTPFEAVEDAKSAIRYVRTHAKELNINPNMIAAGGGSAGGHLAAACGNTVGLDNPQENLETSSVPNALALLNPVIDNGPNSYGYNRFKERFKEISPIHNITKDAPPTIILIGTKDRLIPVSTIEKYKSKMEAVGSRCDLILYKDQPHGFFNKTPNFIKTTNEIDLFLKSLGFLKNEPTIKKQYHSN
tara:strand:+ start:6067 stop:6960 length:894 start_codon:yes stop_codon:yes gene_type:complete